MTASPIRLLLVDDHAAFRLPLALILEREPDLMVVAQAGSLAEARAVLPEIAGRVDVALVDLHLPDGNGVEVVRDLRAANPRGQTIVLTADLSAAPCRCDRGGRGRHHQQVRATRRDCRRHPARSRGGVGTASPGNRRTLASGRPGA